MPHQRISRFRTAATTRLLGIARHNLMDLPESSKTQMRGTHTSTQKKDVGRVSTPHLDDEDVGETSTISSRSGRISEKKYERFESEELEFFPPKVPSDESAGIQICQEPDDNLVEGESEGEAPETITAAVGLHQSRSLARKAARAIERYRFLLLTHCPSRSSCLIHVDKK